MPRLVTSACFVAVLFAAIAGCQKVSQKKTYAVQPGEWKGLQIEGPAREQSVTVKVTSDNPVDVYITAGADFDALTGDGKVPKTPLASKQGAKDETLTATVPAKTAYGIVVGNAKTAANVSLDITGK